MTTFLTNDSDLLGPLATDPNCCCEPLPCNGCCLPLDEECQEVCYPDSPRLYLDFEVSGVTCGSNSFTHIPLGGDYTWPGNSCHSVLIGRNVLLIPDTGNDGWIVTPLNAYTFTDTRVSCHPFLGDCGVGESYDNWTLGFGVACEPGEGGQPSGRLLIYMTYQHNSTCYYDNTERESQDPFDYSVTVAKCWSVDGAVDMTIVLTRTAYLNECDPFYPGFCETRTFIFRVYTD